MPVDTVDYQFKKANIYKDSRSGFLKKLKLPFWDKFCTKPQSVRQLGST